MDGAPLRGEMAPHWEDIRWSRTDPASSAFTSDFISAPAAPDAGCNSRVSAASLDTHILKTLVPSN